MNSNFIKQINFLLVLFLPALLTLSGCGGGSSSTASTENNLPSPVAGGVDGEAPSSPTELALLPTVSVGQRQFADPNVLLVLRGSVVPAEGTNIVKTLWTQVTGPQVRIASPASLDNIVLLPDVSVATQMEFRLTAEDNKGKINSATLSILVKPVPTFVKVIGGVFDENDSNAIFTVRLNAPSDLPVTVTYITRNATALAEVDYLTKSGSVVFAAGEVSKEIPVMLISDFIEETDESFSLQVTAVNGEKNHTNSGVAIIHNIKQSPLQQSLAFLNKGPISLLVEAVYRNPFDTAVASPGTGAITYSSSNSSVASVDLSGSVLAVSLGTTTITASKAADAIYSSAVATYDIKVVSGSGNKPTVTLDLRDGFSVDIGTALALSGTASDTEDGALPTQAQTAESAATGQPIKSLSWSSSIDGFLGNGVPLNTSSLKQGTHVITYSVTDSDLNIGVDTKRILVGNIAPFSTASATTTLCIPGSPAQICFLPSSVNDMNLSTKVADSWANDSMTLPQSVVLTWPAPATIKIIDVYSSDTEQVSDYDLEYFDGMQSWLPLVSVKSNLAAYRQHVLPNAVVTTQLRLVVRVGSVSFPKTGRVNELAVFGTRVIP
jgi:Calx-beta domain/Bacterial Ig-like domain (group 2)